MPCRAFASTPPRNANNSPPFGLARKGTSRWQRFFRQRLQTQKLHASFGCPTIRTPRFEKAPRSPITPLWRSTKNSRKIRTRECGPAWRATPTPLVMSFVHSPTTPAKPCEPLSRSTIRFRRTPWMCSPRMTAPRCNASSNGKRRFETTHSSTLRAIVGEASPGGYEPPPPRSCSAVTEW